MIQKLARLRFPNDAVARTALTRMLRGRQVGLTEEEAKEYRVNLSKAVRLAAEARKDAVEWTKKRR